MKSFKSAVEAAREALGREIIRSCETCRHYLGDGHCGVNLELECKDGGYEAWEAGSDDG